MSASMLDLATQSEASGPEGSGHLAENVMHFARVLREHGQNVRRGRAKAPKAGRLPTTHVATAPRQVWCWDMTYLPAEVVGRWFHLYLILDLLLLQIKLSYRIQVL